MPNRIRMAVAGAAGRMGQATIEAAPRHGPFEVAAALETAECVRRQPILSIGPSTFPLCDTLEAPCDVLVDFTGAGGTIPWVLECEKKNLPMVIGATGHSAGEQERIVQAARTIPIVQATNFSMGIHLVLRLLREISSTLSETFDVEVIESHHRHKIDAPSGTALRMVEEILAARRGSRADVVFGRRGRTGERPAGQIGVHSVRMGEHVGQHEVHFSGPGETITLRHRAHSREAFAAGALRAAAWVMGKPPGLYGVEHVFRAGMDDSFR